MTSNQLRPHRNKKGFRRSFKTNDGDDWKQSITGEQVCESSGPHRTKTVKHNDVSWAVIPAGKTFCL